MEAKEVTRVVTNEDIARYEGMVMKYLRDNIIKNWKNEGVSPFDVDSTTSLGNTGYTVADFKQYLMMEVVVALQNYDSSFKNADGVGTKESTFVYNHLFNRTGGTMKKLTSVKAGYGMWGIPVEILLTGESNQDDWR